MPTNGYQFPFHSDRSGGIFGQQCHNPEVLSTRSRWKCGILIRYSLIVPQINISFLLIPTGVEESSVSSATILRISPQGREEKAVYQYGFVGTTYEQRLVEMKTKKPRHHTGSNHKSDSLVNPLPV